MPFEVGTYRGQLKGGVVTTARTGTEQMALMFDVTEYWNGASHESVTPPAERTVFLSLTDKAMPYTKTKLESLNFNGDFEDPQFQTDPEGAQLTCTEDTYQGKKHEKWDLAGFGGNLEKAGTDKLRRLNARWKAGGGKTTKAKTAAPAAPAAPSGPPPATPARTSTRDLAWANLVKLWSDKKDEAELTEQWHEAIAERRKPEDTFTAEDWGHVEASFEIPF